MNTSTKIDTVAAGLYAVQKDLRNPGKDAKGQVRGNPNYRYLSLPALIDVLRPLLKDHNLAVTQEITGVAGGVGVSTVVMSNTGEWLEYGPTVIPSQANAQDYGSAITYGRRYALAAIFNIAADEDDDGSRASAASSQARSHGTPDSSGLDGAAEERGGGGEAPAYGEGADVEPTPPPQGTTSTSGDAHPGRDHVLGPAGNPDYAKKGVKQCRIAGCDFMFWPAGVAK